MSGIERMEAKVSTLRGKYRGAAQAINVEEKDDLPLSESVTRQSRELLYRKVWDNPELSLSALKDALCATQMSQGLPSEISSISEVALQNSMARARKLRSLASQEVTALQKLASDSNMSTKNTFSFHIFQEEKSVRNTDGLFDKDQVSEPLVNNKFSCLHQTLNQQRMLKRYGNMVYLTCLKRLSYKLPFFAYALFVQTNMDFQLVAFFVCSSADLLHHVLAELKNLNPYWLPLHLSLDLCSEQASAAVKVFPSLSSESALLINAHARRDAWKEWLHLENYAEADARDILRLFESIAQSRSEDSLNKSAKELEISEWWKGKPLRDWFSAKWLTEATRWVVGYQADTLVCPVPRDLTLEQQVGLIEDMLDFPAYKVSCLEEIMSKLERDVAPSLYARYVELNKLSFENQLSRCVSNPGIPRYLRNKPDHVVEHVLNMHDLTKKEQLSVQQKHPGLFWVSPGPSCLDTAVHAVSFGDGLGLPSCDCDNWLTFCLPCQHMCTVFDCAPGWCWDMLPSSYIGHPQINLDWSCLWEVMAGRCLSASMDHNYVTESLAVLQTRDACDKLRSSVQHMLGEDLLNFRKAIVEILQLVESQIYSSLLAPGSVAQSASTSRGLDSPKGESTRKSDICTPFLPESLRAVCTKSSALPVGGAPVESAADSLTTNSFPVRSSEQKSAVLKLDSNESGSNFLGLTISRVSKRPAGNAVHLSPKRTPGHRNCEEGAGGGFMSIRRNHDGAVASTPAALAPVYLIVGNPGPEVSLYSDLASSLSQ